jgi:hypothetical protein
MYLISDENKQNPAVSLLEPLRYIAEDMQYNINIRVFVILVVLYEQRLQCLAAFRPAQKRGNEMSNLKQ